MSVVEKKRMEIVFSEVATEWLNIKKPQLKPASIAKYYNILDWYLFPEFKKQIVSQITRHDVLLFSRSLLINGGVKSKKLSPKTINGILSVLKSIFDYSLIEKGVDVANIKDISIKQTQKPMRILSLSEQKSLNQYLLCHLNPCYLGILLSLYTGMRIGEICALKWSDIRVDEQYIDVHQSMQRIQIISDSSIKTKIIIQTPKSECSIRKIPIPKDLLSFIVLYQEKDDAFLLTGQNNKYIEPRCMENKFKNVASKCNITGINYHSLRHTFATRCVELGFDIKSLSEILGHANVSITLNRYVHPSMELKQKNMDMLSSIMTFS